MNIGGPKLANCITSPGYWYRWIFGNEYLKLKIYILHSISNITLDLYGHLYHEMQEEAAKVMDELVTPISIGLEDIGVAVQNR